MRFTSQQIHFLVLTREGGERVISEIYDLKPVVYKLRNWVEEGQQEPRKLVEVGLCQILGYLSALEGFAIYFEEGYSKSVKKGQSLMGELISNYRSAKEPALYAPTGQEIEALLAICSEISGQSLKVGRRDFAHAYTASIDMIREKVGEGLPSLDDAYEVFGLLSAFDMFDYCHDQEIFRQLVHHMESYASSWPAKFALGAVQEALTRLALDQKRRLVA